MVSYVVAFFIGCCIGSALAIIVIANTDGRV